MPATPQSTAQLVVYIYDLIEAIARVSQPLPSNPASWKLHVERPEGGAGVGLDDLVLAGIVHLGGTRWIPLLYIDRGDQEDA